MRTLISWTIILTAFLGLSQPALGQEGRCLEEVFIYAGPTGFIELTPAMLIAPGELCTPTAADCEFSFQNLTDISNHPDGLILEAGNTYLYVMQCIFACDGLGCTGVITVCPQPSSDLTNFFVFSDAGQECPGGNQQTGGGPSPGEAPEVVCAGTTVEYFWEWAGANTRLEIEVAGADSFERLDSSILVNWGTPGLGQIDFLLLDSSQCSPYVLATVEVDVLPLPVPSFELPGTMGDTLFLCQGQPLEAINTSQFAERYLWSFGDGNFSTRAQPTHAYSSPGTYTLELTAFNACDCSDTQQVTVVVEEGSVPSVDCVSTICEGGVSTYSTSSDCGTFLWSISDNGEVLDGGGPEDNYITVQWSTGPEGEVTLAVEDCPTASSACDAPFQARVPIVSDNLSLLGRSTVCRGELAAYTLPDYEGASIQWSVSSLGSIVSGQGTAEVNIRWSSGPISGDEQWVAVEVDHCYLGCQTQDTLSVQLRPELYLLGPIEACQGSSQIYEALSRPGNTPVFSNWAVVDQAGDTVLLPGSLNSTININWELPPGDYRLVAQAVLAGDYCSGIISRSVRVVAPPTLLGGIMGDTLICPDILYTYEALSASPDTRFLWEIVDGGTISTQMGRRINLSFGASPPYTLIVQPLDALGCAGRPDTLNVAPLTELSIEGPDRFCPQSPASYTATDYGGLDYEWSISPSDAGTIISGAGRSDVEILWHRSGPARLQVDVCGLSAVYDIAINEALAPQVAAPSLLCPGDSAIVQATPLFDTYTWSNAAGEAVSNAASPMLPPGFYQLQVTDADGCPSDTTFRIAAREAPTAYITTPDPDRCCGIPPVARLFTSESGIGYAYQWLYDGNPVGADSPQFTTNGYGVYQVQVTDTNGCTALSNTIRIIDCSGSGGTSPSAPNCEALMSIAIQNAADCQDRSYEAALSPNYVPGSIVWSFDDPQSGAANFVTGSLTASHAFANPGYYRVQIRASFENPTTGIVSECSIYRVDTVFAAAGFRTDTTCSGQPLFFENQSAFLPGTTLSGWAWDFGDPGSGADNTATDESPTHIYGSPGTYTASLQAQSSQGCLASIAQEVTILGAPAVSFELPAARCAGQPTVFDADFGPEVIRLSWDFGDPGSGAANTGRGAQAFHQYTAPGTYTVSVLAIGRYGCDSTFTRDITVVANTLAGAIGSTATEACPGQAITLSAPPGGSAWQWNEGSTGSDLTVTETGNYRLTVTDADGCTFSPDAQAVQFFEAPTDSIRAVSYSELGLPESYTYERLAACEGEDVFLEVIGLPNQTYTWSNGQMGTQIEFSDARGNLLSSGSYSFDVTVTDTLSGCSSSIGPFELIVRSLPAVAISAAPSGIACEGTAVTYTVNGPDPALLYIWNNGALGNTMATSQAGDYFVTAVNEFGCEAESNQMRILSGPNASLVPNGCYNRCLPDTLCLPDIPGVATYQWVMDGMPLGTPSSSPPELIVTEDGAYHLDMVGTNGCTATSDPLNLTLFEENGAFTGLVYIDLNNNGVIDPSDSLYNGALIILLQEGSIVNDALTQADSSYVFPELPPGDYLLLLDSLSLPDGLSPLYTQVDTSIAGCGSTFRVDWLLTITCQPDSTFIELSGCDSVAFRGETYFQDTLLSFISPGVQGCDTTELVDIRVLATSDSTLLLGACEGTTVSYEGVTLMPGQQQQFTFENAAGCDSIVTVIVQALTASDTTLTLGACEGATVSYEGVALMPGQQQQFTFENAVGCDSTVTVNVQALAASDTTLTLGACEGATVSYEGVALMPGQQQQFTFENAVGCDSIVTVTVQALAPSDITLTLGACEGATVSYEGVALMPGQQQQFTFENAVGCDSIVTVIVQALTASDTTLTLGACEGATVSYEGVALMPGQQQQFTFENAVGCDSTVTVNVQALPKLAVEVMADTADCEQLTSSVRAIVRSGDDGNLSLIWSNGDTGPNTTFPAPGQGELTVSNDCETMVLPFDLPVEGQAKEQLIYLPNAFSPNGDGRNDVFQAYLAQGTEWRSFRLAVFDRWGNQLFETTRPQMGWDGTFRGERMSTGVYLFHLTGAVDGCGQAFLVELRGDVTLVR